MEVTTFSVLDFRQKVLCKVFEIRQDEDKKVCGFNVLFRKRRHCKYLPIRFLYQT